MATLARVYIGCHWSGRASRPRDSEGNSTPVGLPKPKSRSTPYCSSGESRCANLDIAMLLETWMAWASVSIPACRCASAIRRVLPRSFTGISHSPFSPLTASVLSTRR